MQAPTAVALVLGAPLSVAAQSVEVDFARDVAPVLAASCVGCHGPARAEAGLRLDTREGLLAGGDSGSAVTPGDASASLLYQRLVVDDESLRMPWYMDPLTPAQIDRVRGWIDGGASWPEALTVEVAVAAVAVAASLATAAVDVDTGGGDGIAFNRDIRPILANCLSCHGPDRNQRQAGLRLDREEAARSELPSGATAIVPGSPETSALMARVLEPDEGRRMPHVSSGKPRLTASEVAKLREWIAAGARWEPHWSYVPPRRATPPAVSRTAWSDGAIDPFVLAGIEEAGLAPSPEADPVDLLRRLSFDLTGLPPTPEEVRAFAADASVGAYERQVDRLLASPHYGERMAVFWLDLVRYADSVGYHSDNPRPMWRYRDWVVSAFNENVPFDRFTTEQLAGDLLENPTFEQRIASGYNRLLQTTEEGGAQPGEYRAIYLADRVRNASTVWLGATVGCAQCHDHKFDPYLAKDFASFGAFFADIVEPPVGRRRPDALPDDTHREPYEAAEAEVERLEDVLDEKVPPPGWEDAIRETPVCWTTLEPVEVASEKGTRVLIQGNDFSLIATTKTGPKPSTDSYTVRFETALRDITAFRLEAVPFEELPKGGPGRDPEGGFVVSELRLLDALGRTVALEGAGDAWSLEAGDGETHRRVLPTATPLEGGEGTSLTLVLRQDEGGGRTLGRFRVSATAERDPVCFGDGPGVSRGLVEIVRTPRDERTESQQESLLSYYRGNARELRPLRGELRAASLRRDALLEDIPQSYITTTEEPEPVRILPRGNWLDESGPIVEPAVPEFLPPIETGGERATRLDLARWLTSPDNPLTSRVLANRLWRLFFGQGLSTTLDDLGTQGAWPTHPELLDWLAVELVESGWDVKHLVKTIVMSKAYRQSSRPTPELLERDPDNRLYARQSRFRLDAEMVRDQALRVSGLLSDTMGGESVFPYQPLGYWSFLNFPPREWDDSKGEDQYRRGLYTWWQRSFPQPSLVAFDAPTREECVSERTRSNIPQHALVLLNDPTYVEAARVFAANLLASGGETFEERLVWAYGRALSRAPRPEEVAILRDLYEKHRAEYRERPADAAALVAVGFAPRPSDVDVVELAAWTSVARTILNLPELITRR